MTRAFVTGRKRKGRRIGRLVRQVRADLRGWKVDSRTVRRKRTLRRLAARKAAGHVDIVVAVGGDGAVGQVATSLAGTGVALGIVPAGTGNLLASNLGIPKRRDHATKTLLAGRRRRIDLGRVSVGDANHDFAVACGVGGVPGRPTTSTVSCPVACPASLSRASRTV